MKQLQTRLVALESAVKMVVDKLSSLKEENDKLSSENNRLHTELNQLRKSVEGGSLVKSPDDGIKAAISKRDIKIDHLKEELDRCIEEVEACLKSL